MGALVNGRFGNALPFFKLPTAFIAFVLVDWHLRPPYVLDVDCLIVEARFI
jgi:hypothetical protein